MEKTRNQKVTKISKLNFVLKNKYKLFKRSTSLLIANLIFFSCSLSFNNLSAQYSESFSTPAKGYKLSCADDFTGVNWALSPWTNDMTCSTAGNRDSGDYFNTTVGGVLESSDLDQEVYWESPLMNISAAGTVTLSVALSWIGFDTDVMTNTCGTDYIRVQYSINGGAYVNITNQFGGSTCATVGYPFENPGTQYNGSGTVTQGGISGTTLKIRVAVFTNATLEVVTIDNVSVPQAGVTIGCAAPVLSTVLTQVGCSNINSGAINLSVSAGTPVYTYDWSNDGPENPDNDSQDLSGLPVGTYTVTVTDAASCSATTSVVISNAPALALSTQVLNTSCGGTMDGEIDLDVSGGVPGYTYDWSNNGPQNPDSDAQDLIGIGMGNYTVTVTDASGCTATTSATVVTLPAAAYNEQFNVASKGYLANYVDDFAGVNWTMTPWLNEPGVLFGRDNADFFRTSGGALVGEDFDQDICWESPLISLNGGTQFSVDLAWTGFDNQADEYINVKYSVNGGAFVTIPSVVGMGAGTIQYASGLDNNGSTTVTKTGLSGTTIKIQVCGQFNSNNENMTIDNVSVPGSLPYCPCSVISVTNPVTTTGTTGTSFSQTFTASGGTAPYSFAIDAGTLPEGLSLSSGGVLSGVPLTPGSFAFSVSATDALGCAGIGASYTLMIGGCPLQPTISGISFLPADPCQNVNHDISGITIIPATPGVNYEYRYSLDGGPFVGNSSFGGIPVGPHCFGVKVFATAAVACGMPLTNYTNGDEIPGTLRTYCMYFGSSGPPAIAANNILGNTLCVTSITPTPVPNRPCFTYEYSVDGGAWSSVVPIPVTPGCHTLQNRVVCGGLSGGSFGCFAGAPSPASAATDFSIFHDLAAIPDASITINRNCSSGANGSITSIMGLPAAPAGFVYQYSVDNAAFSVTFPTNLVPGCHNVTIIQAADCPGSTGDGITPVMCRKTLNFVIYPFALVISATTNTCASMFTLPSVPPIGGFSVEYSLDGGAWTANPSTTTPGCHTIAARYVTEGCIAPPYNEVPAGEFSDGTISSCTAPSNTVSMVIFPQITAVPTSASKSTVCGAANITFNWVAAPTNPLLGTAPAGGSFELRYDIDGGTAFTNTNGIFTGVTPGCHTIEARYVLTTNCDPTEAPAVAPAACGVSRIFIVWANISASTLSVTLNNNCGAGVNVSAVTFAPALGAIPPGQEIVYSGSNNGVAFGPVNLAGLTAINFVPGCHSISARLRATTAYGVAPDGASVNDLSPAACGTALINFITFPPPPTLTAPTNTCNSAFAIPTVATVLGFTVQWSIDGGTFTATPVAPVTPGCHNVRAQYVLTSNCLPTLAGTTGTGSCGISNMVNVVIFPTAPVIAKPADRCNAAFTLPSVTAVAGFNVEYRIDNNTAGTTGTWSTAPVIPTGPACYAVSARYVTVADCGVVPQNVIAAGTAGTAPCGSSNTQNVVIFPAAPNIADPAVACASAFTLPTVPAIAGFNVYYSIDGGAYAASPSTTTPGCHTVTARYILAADCLPSTPAGTAGSGLCGPSNTVNVVIFPQITAVPTSASKSTVCGAANITFNWVAAPTSPLPGTAPAGGSFSLRYDIDGGTAFTNTTGIFPGVTPGCHTIEARYVLTTDCGTTTSPAVAPEACGVSRIFIVWANISASTLSVALNNNCGAAVNVSAVTFSPALPSIPAGQEVVYSGVNNGAPFGPVNLAGLTAINFVPGSHSISARLRATAACGVAPDGASVNDLSPATCGTALINFITFLSPPTITLSSAPSTNVQTVVLNNPITNITYNTTGATGATFSGLPPGVMGAWSGNMVTISGAPNSNAMSPYNYTVTLTGGCNTVTAMGTITVIVGVAQIMGVGYNTLQQALNAAVDDDEIMLLMNIAESGLVVTNSIKLNAGAFTLTASGLTIPAGKYMRWLTNTLTIPATYSITNTGTLWNNGTITHVGPFTNAGTYKGTGTFNGNFTNNGSMQPGN